MVSRRILLATGLSLAAPSAYAKCAFRSTVPLKLLSAAFEAWKVVTNAMAECGNFLVNLDQNFQEKEEAAFAVHPALYQLGGVANDSLAPLLSNNLIRPLDSLVAKYGHQLEPNQLIKVGGKTMSIAFMINTQNLVYREDILSSLGIAVPATYDEVLAAAQKIEAARVVDYPLGGTFKPGYDLGKEFVNMYFGFGGTLFRDSDLPAISNEKGVATLVMLKRLAEYMDPDYLSSESTYVQQQFQQGKIAMANLWASRLAALDDPAESRVVGKIKTAAAPAAIPGGIPAATVTWDGIVIPRNIPDGVAEAAFRVAMEGIDANMVKANNDVAIWLIKGYMPGSLAKGALETVQKGARPYPTSLDMGLLHTALGNGIAPFLEGHKTAAKTLADIEGAYLTAARETGLVR